MYDVLIIGAGPGGMTAAIYTQRANLKTAMIEKAAPGGYMLDTWEIENYPGVGVVSGFELSDKMFKHTQELGVEYLYGDVTKIETEGDVKKVYTADEKVYETKALILASGTNPRKVGVPGEDKFISKGISFCAVCDGAFFKDKEVIVLGGGNSALDEAIYLTTMNVKVTIINILPDLQADKGTIEKAKKNDMIDFILGHEVVSFNGDDKLESATIRDVETKEERTLEVQGTFIFIGQIPNTEYVKDLGITNKQGYIKTNDKMETGIPGVYAIGDVIEKDLRQIVTATSDGAIASQQVAKYIENLDD
ncbi:MAG: thioredoxin-disulfide reductase [Bacillota bacterium]